jgi:hypothetical protein
MDGRNHRSGWLMVAATINFRILDKGDFFT